MKAIVGWKSISRHSGCSINWDHAKPSLKKKHLTQASDFKTEKADDIEAGQQTQLFWS